MSSEVCTPWVEPEQMCCAGDQEVASCGGPEVDLEFKYTDEEYALAASNILYARTCYRFPGSCTVSIWPCMRGCCIDHPYACAPCVRGSTIWLDGFRIRDVVVEIDGDAVDSDLYRVQGRRLIRTDGQSWPRSNNFGIGPGTETIVTYTSGMEPPIELKMAAAALACELKTACEDPSKCALPSRVTSVSRSGVSMTLMDLQQLLSTGKTGIPAVDYALDAHGNCASDGLYDPMAPVTGYVVP